MKTIYIYRYGRLTTQEKGKYEIVLTGSYRWSQFRKMYEHDIDRKLSDSPLTYYYHKTILV